MTGDEIETNDLPRIYALDAAIFTPPNAGHAECPHCGVPVRLLRAEIYLIDWPKPEETA